jgi:hypothetical protein
MNIWQRVMSVMLVVLVLSPEGALAQGRGPGMGRHGGMGHERGAMRQLQPLMQQMSELMQQVAERIKAGPLTPDQALQLSTLVGQMAVMMGKLSGGMPGADSPTQTEGMQARLTEMQQTLATLAVPPARPEMPPEKP